MQKNILNQSTKQATTILERYYNSNFYNLDYCYSSCSYAKKRAEKAIIEMMDQQGGRGYRIISYNTNMFTCAFMGFFQDEKTGKNYKALHYFTNSKYLIIPLEEIEREEAQNVAKSTEKNQNDYSYKDFESDFNSLSEETKEHLKNSGIVLTSMEQARDVMKFSKMFNAMQKLFK